jgi:hypothetical protein
MTKRRVQTVGLLETVGDRTFRATGITAFRKNGGSIEHAQQFRSFATWVRPRTTAYVHSAIVVLLERPRLSINSVKVPSIGCAWLRASNLDRLEGWRKKTSPIYPKTPA